MNLMKMKKTVVLAVVLMFVMSSVCMAFPIESPSWELIGSNEEMSVFFDANSLTHYDGGAFCNVDILIEFPAQKKMMVMNHEYSKGLEVRILSLKEYDTRTGDLLRVEENPNGEWHAITPGSMFEVIWNHVI